MELTPVKAKLYLDSCGVKCPYCGSTDISGHSLEIEASIVTQTIDCSNCNEQWSDIYTLVGIADANGNRIEPTPEPKTCWVLVGTYRGLVDPDPQVFFDEKPALKARSAMDQKLGIKRKKGDYKHDENTCTLYEIEIK